MVLQVLKKGVRLGMKGARLSSRYVKEYVKPYVKQKLLKPREAKELTAFVLTLAKEEARAMDNFVKSRLTQEIRKMGFVHKSDTKKSRKKKRK